MMSCHEEYLRSDSMDLAVEFPMVGLNIFYLYTLYIQQHIKTYNNTHFS